MSHDHSHSHSTTQRSALRWALGANGVLLIVQIIAGIILGSLSLLADSLHNASDVAALIIALVGQVMAARPATRRHSYGLARAEVLAALINGAVLVATTGWIIVVAVQRLGSAPSIDALPLGVIGVVGLAVNGISAWVLGRTAAGNLNMRAAFWHLTADALGSLGVVLAAVGMGVFGFRWADPVASILISVLVLAGVVRLLRDTVYVLLETTPPGVDPSLVEQTLQSIVGIESVHHLHIWSIDSEQTALTAHLVMSSGIDLHGAQLIATEGRATMRNCFEIDHVTFEIECHDCDEPVHGDRDPVDSAAGSHHRH